ncbi:AAA family ATPase [Pacificimonas flava]|uniref:NadR/Ttd14 AAA domain-containing protein n=1 Tax=Pacificimonas flava TaxID=1234595 RepID=M2U2Y7_9SPHN|nr:AAA family ATPase [Pacificimonas flava]EMD82238.1 hypothetical protein C725_2276 [Pacificimonas flava]
MISGCSGGGKSTLIAELARRGFAVSEEIGRAVIASGGPDPAEAPLAFASAVARGERDRLMAHAGADRPVFFDRSLIDQIAFCRRVAGQCPFAHGDEDTLYHDTIFLTPPWPDIYRQDAERRHDFAAATAEYDDLCRAYPAAGYRTVILPKVSVAARADVILRTLALPQLR